MSRKAATQLALHDAVIAKLKADLSIPYKEIAERNYRQDALGCVWAFDGTLSGHVGRVDQWPV